MPDAGAALSYAVRPRVVAKYLGQLGLILAILLLAPLGAALVLGEYAQALRYLVVLAPLVLAAAPVARLPEPAHVQTNEALTVIALAFVLAPLLMTYPLMGGGLGFSAALFESVSAVTTTGLSVLPSVEDRPRAFLFARAWMQWYGGLGFVVLSIALLMGHHAAAHRFAEPYGGETLLTTARTHARRMLAVYLVLTLLGLAALWLALGDGFAALLHVLSAVSTGGFSPYDESLAAIVPWGARYTVVGVALLGAVPLPLYLYCRRGRWDRFLRDGELRALLLAVLAAGAVLGVLFHSAGSEWGTALRHGFLLGISAQTTTGFASMDLAQAPPAAQLVLIAAMVSGGGVGSTAGGVKLLRVLILLRLVQLVVRRATLAPHAFAEARLGGKTLSDDDLQRALVLIVLYGVVVLLSWFAFLVYGHPPLSALFEVVSATSTVGLSTGLANADLAAPLQAVLCADMLLGRVEIIALVVVLYPRNWIGKRVEHG